MIDYHGYVDYYATGKYAKDYNVEQDLLPLFTALWKYGIHDAKTIKQSASMITYSFELPTTAKSRTILNLDYQIMLKCSATRAYIKDGVLYVEKPIDGDTVKIGNFIPSLENQAPGELRFIVGEDTLANKVTYDLCKAPHMLIAGETGSGKSVFLHQIICSLIAGHPNDMELYLIDPKGNELNVYDGYPYTHFCSFLSNAINMLREMSDKVSERYISLSKMGFKSIDEYNEKCPAKKMKKCVIVIDEFADLMMQDKKDVEAYVSRIAALGRACGVHLIMATQTPRAQFVTGVIKANLPTKVALRVGSALESRIILDQNGAERLSGHGDMLFLAAGQGEPIRCHGALLSTMEEKNFINLSYDYCFDDNYIGGSRPVEQKKSLTEKIKRLFRRDK